jgi:adenine-specific DNA methylase
MLTFCYIWAPGRVLRNNGLLVLFFAHSKLDAWKILISSLIDGGFRVTMAWPVGTESPTSVVQRGKASIQSSILVAARKQEEKRAAFLEDLRDEVASHVMKSLSEISDLTLTGADMIVAGLGKALEIATSYSELKSYSGNATLESLLEVVSQAVYSYSVERLIKRPLAALDPQTAFYVFVKCGYGGLIPPDDALMICKGAGVELRALQHNKIIDKKKIGTRTILATLNAYERNLDLEKPPELRQ